MDIEDAGVRNYVSMTSAVMSRLSDAIERLAGDLNDGVAPSNQNMEFAALQIRLSCEAVLFATFEIHAHFVEDLLDRMVKGDKFDDIKKKLERENARYLPEPTIVSDKSGTKTVSTDRELMLSGDDILKIWGKASEVLHHRNPKKKKIDNFTYCAELHHFASRLMKILLCHTIYLPGLDTIYLIHQKKAGSSDISWKRLNRINEKRRPIARKRRRRAFRP